MSVVRFLGSPPLALMSRLEIPVRSFSTLRGSVFLLIMMLGETGIPIMWVVPRGRAAPSLYLTGPQSPVAKEAAAAISGLALRGFSHPRPVAGARGRR